MKFLDSPPNTPEDEEEDLWFLPAPLEDAAPTDLPAPLAPLPVKGWSVDWARAEAGLGRPLAEAWAALARLDEKVAATKGAAEWIALGEASALSWYDGRRIAPERLALYAELRVSTAEDDARDLALADWARRRLVGAVAPEDIEAFFGFEDQNLPRGEDGLDWLTAIRGGVLHPLTAAAMAFHDWKRIGLSGPESVLEAATLAMRVAATGLRTLPFAPMASVGMRAIRSGGPVEERLLPWFEAIRNGAQEAYLTLDRLQEWGARAHAAIAPMSGRTPERLVSVLLEVPFLSAEMAEVRTGASRAAVQRNLDRLAALGLVKEVTGQRRYRYWTAAI